MKNAIPLNVALGLIITFLSYSLSAQQTKISNFNSTDVAKTQEWESDYLELKKLGYAEKEIFEDLGNANFLLKKYDSALFWYEKLKEVSQSGTLSTGFTRRYNYAKQMATVPGAAASMENEDWLTTIQADYGITTSDNSLPMKYRPLDSHLERNDFVGQRLLSEDSNSFSSNLSNNQKSYKVPITVTADGNTAFFSKAVYVKPPIGIFSKKELVHKIYRAEKMNGKWQNIKEMPLCPKYYSALHPTVSYDGRQLYFASNMPGTFGKYDIYVSTLHRDGSFGMVKNLGEKVNTKKNDMYPKIIGGNTLFFASNGRKGLGGLDVYMVEVNSNKVGLATNLGNTLNSQEDDFAIHFMPDKGMAYVISNRGKDKEALHQVAFSYNHLKNDITQEKTAYNVLEVLNTNSKIDYSSSTFEDE